MRIAYLLLFTLALGDSAVGLNGGECRRYCRCFVNSDSYNAANCSTAAFSLHADHKKSDHSVLALNLHHHNRQYAFKLFPSMFKSFKNVQFLDLSNCSIVNVPNDVFTGLVYVRDIDLSFNNIKHLNGAVFSGLRNLHSLAVRGNPLYISPWNAIVSKSLRELDMSYCSLQNLPADTFAKVGNLVRLYLDGNELNTVGHILPSGLSYLNLARNNIVNVPIDVLVSMTYLKMLDLSENPVNCTCHLLLLQDLYSGRGIAFENDVVCAYPPQYAGRRIVKINEDELCKDELFTKEGHINNIGYTSMYALDKSKRQGRHNVVYEPSVMADQPAMEAEEVSGVTDGVTHMEMKTEDSEDSKEEEDFEYEPADVTTHDSKATDANLSGETEYEDVGNESDGETSHAHHNSTTDHDNAATSEQDTPDENNATGEDSEPSSVSVTVTPELGATPKVKDEDHKSTDQAMSLHPEDSVEYTSVNETSVSHRSESLINETPAEEANTNTQMTTEDTEEWSGDGASSVETAATSSEETINGGAEDATTVVETPKDAANITEEEGSISSPSPTDIPSDSISSKELDYSYPDTYSTFNETESAESALNSTEESDFDFSVESTSENILSFSEKASETTIPQFSEQDASSVSTTDAVNETTTIAADDKLTDEVVDTTTDKADDTTTDEVSDTTTVEGVDTTTEINADDGLSTHDGAAIPTGDFDGTTTEEDSGTSTTDQPTEVYMMKLSSTSEPPFMEISSEEASPIPELTTPEEFEETTVMKEESLSPVVVSSETSTTGEPYSTAAPIVVPIVHDKTVTSAEVTSVPLDTTEAEIVPITSSEVQASPPDEVFSTEGYRGTAGEKQESKQSTGSYIVVGLIAVLVLGLIVLAVFKSRRRSGKPSKVRLPNDLESNPGTEMRDMDTLLPKPPENGVVKIVPRDYGEQKPVNGEVKEEAQPLNRHEAKDNLEAQPLVARTEDHEEQHEHNGNIQKATARLTLLPQPQLQTPVFIHKPYPDE